MYNILQARHDILLALPHIKSIGNELYPRSNPGNYSQNNVSNVCQVITIRIYKETGKQ